MKILGETMKGYCKNCDTKLEPTMQLLNGYVCRVCGSVYLKDKLGRFRFYY